MTKVYHTGKAKEPPPYGAFDDEIVFQVQDQSESFVMRKYEFEWLMGKIFDQWQKGRNLYIQLLQEWNESLGFQAIDGQASILKDLDHTIDAFRMVEPSTENSFNHIEAEDFVQLLQFLERNKEKQVEVFER